MDTRVLAGLLYLDEADPNGLRVKFRMAEDSVTFSTSQETLGTWTPLGTEVEEVGTERFRLRLGNDLVLFAPDDPVEFKYEIAPKLGDRSPKRSRRASKKLRTSAMHEAEPAQAQLVHEAPSPAVVPPPEQVAKAKTVSPRPVVKPEPAPAPDPKTKQEMPARRPDKPQAAPASKPGQTAAPSTTNPEPKPKAERKPLPKTGAKPVAKTEAKPVPKAQPRPVRRAESEPMPKQAATGPRTVIEPPAAQERSAVRAVAHEPIGVAQPPQPDGRSIPVRSPSQAQDLMADLKRRLGRKEPSAPHRHSFSSSGVPGGLVRFVCAGCGHVSIDLTSEPATTERAGSLFRKGIRL